MRQRFAAQGCGLDRRTVGAAFLKGDLRVDPRTTVADLAAWRDRYRSPGGIGLLINQSIKSFQFDVMLTHIMVVLVLIIVVDQFSAWVRARLTV